MLTYLKFHALDDMPDTMTLRKQDVQHLLADMFWRGMRHGLIVSGDLRKEDVHYYQAEFEQAFRRMRPSFPQLSKGES